MLVIIITKVDIISCPQKIYLYLTLFIMSKKPKSNYHLIAVLIANAIASPTKAISAKR